MPPIYDYECPRCGLVREVLVKTPFEVIRCKGTHRCCVKMRRMMPAPGLLKTNFQNSPSPKSRQVVDRL